MSRPRPYMTPCPTRTRIRFNGNSVHISPRHTPRVIPDGGHPRNPVRMLISASNSGAMMRQPHFHSTPQHHFRDGSVSSNQDTSHSISRCGYFKTEYYP
ncbi:hypothetical protein FA13DRAFT_1726120 [Coprinellus micaceus]|uniref:Uncharacterized protein n=1 Tax=Coprinellus micaceus TaxID=71717 RepID=A0A4Y7TWR8_COPMI|nr:hypothetical protein FA13DRAFT_1726120 [Coprinellus micaceus]